MNAPEIVCHRIRNVVAHPHRPGIVVCSAKIVPAILERSKRCQAVCGCSRRHGNRAARVGKDFKRLIPGEDQRNFVRDRIHRGPCIAIVVGLSTSGKLLGGSFRIPEGDDGTRPPEINVGRGQTDKTIGIARRHVANATDGDDDRIVGGTK